MQRELLNVTETPENSVKKNVKAKAKMEFSLKICNISCFQVQNMNLENCDKGNLYFWTSELEAVSSWDTRESPLGSPHRPPASAQSESSATPADGLERRAVAMPCIRCLRARQAYLVHSPTQREVNWATGLGCTETPHSRRADGAGRRQHSARAASSPRRARQSAPGNRRKK